MNDDDDLPVLTQVLRTGRPTSGESTTPVTRAADALDPRIVPEAPWLADQLVIGHEPASEVGSYLVPSFDVSPATSTEHESRTDEVPHAPPPVDAFVLPQDHDAPQTTGISYDEPEWRPEPVVASPPEDPEAFARRVRDAVLDSLATRIDTELDARIAQAIHVEVETALGQLQARLRTALADALKDVVGRAVDEEIARHAALQVESGHERRDDD